VTFVRELLERVWNARWDIEVPSPFGKVWQDR
jgi:hypothetical protein